MPDEKRTAPMPMNLEAEEHVIGAALLSTRALEECSEILSARDFYRGSHALIWQAALDLWAAGDAVDPILVADRLDAQGDLEKVGGPGRLAEIVALSPATSNAPHYAAIVHEQAVLRDLIAAGQQIQADALGRVASAADLVERAEGLVFDLSQHRERGDFVGANEVAQGLMARLVELSENGGDITGLPTGFHDLDRLTSGFHPGNLIVVAGRPSMGKTALALCVTTNVLRTGLPVALFTLEMSRWEVMQRLVSIDALVDSQQISTPSRLDRDGWKRVMASGARLAEMPLFIEDSGSVTMMEVRSKARRLKLRHPNLALVIVDYIQLMSSGGGFESRQNEVSQISRGLKLLANELGVPVLALSQLSRRVEERHDKRPMLSDLRESGAIEQDADVVAFVYRDEYYFPEEEDNKGVAEVNVAKQRNGPTGMRRLAFVSRYARFGDLAPTEGPQGVHGYGG
jgi:replicative DNA helicase